MILDGIALRDKGIARLKGFIEASAEKAGASFVPPHLVIVQVGDRKDSNAYVGQKERFGEKIGAKVTRARMAGGVSQQELEAEIEKWNAQADAHGIILQLPITEGLDAAAAIEKIDPVKDVDGRTSANEKSGEVIPATTRGILDLLDSNGIVISGKKAAVIGRSKLVGIPTAKALAARGASAEVIHSKTEHPQAISSAADIVIVATGKGNHFGKDYFSAGQTVVDVGTSPAPAGSASSIQGDVRFSEVEPIVKAISPVPGGVGPMTVLSLFENLMDAYKKQAFTS